MGANRIGIGPDLCQDRRDSIFRWMRGGVSEDGNAPLRGSVKNVRFLETPPRFRFMESAFEPRTARFERPR